MSEPTAPSVPSTAAPTPLPATAVGSTNAPAGTGTSANTPTPARRLGSHRRLWLGLIWSLSALALLALVTVGPLWVLGSTAGATWLASVLPRVGVEVIEPRGTLLGDFQAQKVTVRWAPTERVEIDNPRWTGLTLAPTATSGTWLRIQARSLHADRVSVIVPARPPSDTPPTLPRHVHLPVEIVVADVRASEVIVPGLPDHPFRDVRTAVHLSAPQAPHHRFENASARFEPMLITGHGRIGDIGPMALDIALQARQAPPPLTAAAQQERAAWLPTWAAELRQDWQASVVASGPLARFRTTANVHAQGQHLDASAWVEPISPWPLPELQANTRGLDISALHAQLPSTAITGEVTITPLSAAGPQPSPSASAPISTPAARAPTPTPPPAAARPHPKAWAIRAELQNTRPGTWPEHLLPLRQLQAELHLTAQPALHWNLKSLQAQLADARQPLGGMRLQGQGNASGFDLKAELSALRPSALDPRLPAMTLSGPVLLAVDHPSVASEAPLPVTTPKPTRGKASAPNAQSAANAPASASPPARLPTHFRVQAQLTGRVGEPERAVQLTLRASGTPEHLDLHELLAQAGGAHATVTGKADHSASGWQVQGHAGLVEFDPRPWLPTGPRNGWPVGNYRLNLRGDIALTVPDDTHDARNALDRLAAVRGEATLALQPSVLAGVPLSGELQLRHTVASEPLSARIELQAADNRLKLNGQLAPDTLGHTDRWALQLQAGALGQLAPLLRLVPATPASTWLDGLSGSAETELQINGRWPEFSTQGSATVPSLRAGPLHASQARLRWRVSSQANEPLDVLAEVATLGLGPQHLSQTKLQLQGSAASHELSLRSELKAAPPEWVERLEGRPRLPAGSPPARTLVNANARGSLTGGPLDSVLDGSRTLQKTNRNANAPLSWVGMLNVLELRTEQAGATPWISTRNVGLEMHGGEHARFVMAAGRADILTAGLKWNRIEWQPEQNAQHSQRLDLVAELEPLAVAPLLQRVQPEFGWGGDLKIGGKVNIQQGDTFSADIALERLSGDLSVTDDSGSQPLGLTDLVLGLNAADGHWSFTQGLAGTHLGVAAGAFIVHTSPQLAWPPAQATLQGVFEAKVENLGTWGAWVPTGWRLGGQLRTTASVGGRFGAPEYTGQMRGQQISVRNLLEGVNVQQGEIDITLQGDTARINQVSAKAGAGQVNLSGQVVLGETPRAQLKISAEKFGLISRVDRRLIVSGQADIQLDRDTFGLEGRFDADEGLFDLTRLGAPTLGSDVQINTRLSAEAPAAAASAPHSPPIRQRDTRIKLQLGLGEKLTLRGRGLDAGLRGDIKIATLGDKNSWTGSVRTVDGHYTAYGQKLEIDRGVITVTGSVSDPKLDIKATRPDLDVRVGVTVSGTLLNPRIKLYSEPEMSDIDKLSWLMLGRASEGLGRADTALLQRGALALLAGDDPSVSDQVLKTIGLDELSVRQTEGDTRDTVVSVGKQLTRRWYVGYERGLNTTTGTWQLIYRLAQRFTLRAQSGTDKSLDMLWSWRWE